MSNIICIIVIGFIAGLIARVLSPGPNDPKGFLLTTVLGIAGAFLATFIGQSIGWYPTRSGCRSHRRYGRCGDRVVYLEPARRPSPYSRPGQPQRAVTSPLAVGHSLSFEGAASDIYTRRQTWDWRKFLPV